MRLPGEGGPGCLAYAICLDRARRAAVLTIRGTFSLSNLMTGKSDTALRTSM